MMSRGVMSKSSVNVVETDQNINVAAKGSISSTTRGNRMSGFMPLNADYYVPRPHPPKNN